MDSFKSFTSTHLFTLVRLHFVPWFPLSLSLGDLVSVNGIHQWPIIRWWTTMFDLDTSICIVGHVLTIDCVEDLPEWWHFMLSPWLCQCSWDFISRDLIPVYIRYLQLLWRSWSIVYLQPLWRSWYIVYLHPLWRFWSIVYCTWWWPHMTHFVYHAYSWPLYSYVSGTAPCICSCMQIFIIVL